MRNYLLLFYIIAMFSTSYAGVYRHDVDVARYKELAAQKQFDCAGVVIDEHMSINGSCVLIGDRYVLCAAHVFITTQPATPDTIYDHGDRIILNKVKDPAIDDITKYTFRFKRERYYGKRIMVHPEYLIAIANGNCDVALIELSEPVADIAPAALNTSLDELHCVATGVGWGASGKANEPAHVDIWFEEIAGQNTIDSVAGYMVNGRPTELIADFDHPVNYKDCNKTGSSVPLPLEYMTSGGDSGGGLFRQAKDGSWELIGICTGGGVDFHQLIKTGYYGQMGTWQRVSVFNKWIQDAIARLRASEGQPH